MMLFKHMILSMFTVVMGAILLMPMNVSAKTDETFDVELYEYDDGIWLPKEFKVKDEEGRFATFGLQEEFPEGQVKLMPKGKDRFEELDNGYYLDVYWADCSDPSPLGTQAKPEDPVWCRIVSVYNQDGELMFYNGWTVSYLEMDKGFKYVMTLADDEGNYIDEQYSNPTMSKKNENRTLRDIPLTRRTWDASEKTARDYNGFHLDEGYMERPVEEGAYQYRLFTKYDYSESENGLITNYNMAWGGPEYDEDEDYYRMYTYYSDDVHRHPVVKTSDDGLYITNLYIPDVIYPAFSDEPLYLRIYPKHAGDSEDKVLYLTKEHIDTLDAEGLKYFEDIKKLHPEYEDDEFNATVRFEIVEGENELPEEEKIRQERENAVIEGSSEESSGNTTYSTQGGAYYQELVGDTIPINGMTPKYLLSFEDEHGISLTLYDESNQIVASYQGTSMDHVNFKYAYLTEVYVNDVGGCTFCVAGSDTAVSGNLYHRNTGVQDTDNGTTIGSTYGDGQY